MTETELRPGLDRHQRQLLKKLVANEQSPALAEMARELLAGRTTPTRILQSRAYDEALGAGAEALSSWYAGTSEEDRQAAASQGQTELARLAEEELAGVPDGPEPAKKKPVAVEPEEDLAEQTWSRDAW